MQTDLSLHEEHTEDCFVMQLDSAPIAAMLACLWESTCFKPLCTQSLLWKARSNRDLAAKPQGAEKVGRQQQASHLLISSLPSPSPTGKLLRGRCPQVPGTVPLSSVGLFRHVQAKGKAMFLATGLDTTFLVHSG